MVSTVVLARYIADKFPYGLSVKLLFTLMFLSHALCLVVTHEPLCGRVFTAKRFGVRVNELMQYAPRGYGIFVDDLPRCSPVGLNEVRRQLVDEVVERYGGLTGMDLEERIFGIHDFRARLEEHYGEDYVGVTIDDDVVEEFFARLWGFSPDHED